MTKLDKKYNKKIHNQIQEILSELLNDIKQEDFKKLGITDKIQVIAKLYPLIKDNEDTKEKKNITDFLNFYNTKQQEIKSKITKKK